MTWATDWCRSAHLDDYSKKARFKSLPSERNKTNGLELAEGDLRVALARLLVAENRARNVIFAIEARYGFKDRRADFVMLNEYSHAFEIKSDFDTVARLEEQTFEYVSTFDFLTIVTTELHLSKVRSIVPQKVGLIVFRGGELKRVRSAQQNKRLSKHHLVASISKSTLTQHLTAAQKKSSRRELEGFFVTALKTSELRRLFLTELQSRFAETSNQFFSETDDDIREEDLLLLRRVSRLSQ